MSFFSSEKLLRLLAVIGIDKAFELINEGFIGLFHIPNVLAIIPAP